MALTLEQFIAKWNGIFCEVAGSADAKNQCVDLANAYIRDVLGLPIIEWTNAVDFPVKAGDKYDYIQNTPTGVPQRGDIIVWKPTPGHIAVFLEGDANKFKSFDQNFPTGSTCHIQDHTYQNVTGWLRAKQLPVNDAMYKGYDLTNKESMKVAVDILVRVQAGEFIDKVKYDADMKSKQVTIDNLNSQISKLTSESSAKDTEISSLTSQVTTLTTEVEGLRQQAPDLAEIKKLYSQLQDNYNKAKIDWSAEEQTYNRQIAQLKNTSISTMDTSKLISELVRRVFHINN